MCVQVSAYLACIQYYFLKYADFGFYKDGSYLINSGYRNRECDFFNADSFFLVVVQYNPT